MMTRNENSLSDLPADEKQSDPAKVDRRKALGRFGLYTAPAVVALLIGQPMAVSSGGGVAS
jgi:hypothetical protein